MNVKERRELEKYLKENFDPHEIDIARAILRQEWHLSDGFGWYSNDPVKIIKKIAKEILSRQGLI